MNRCVIITSWQSAPLKESFSFRQDDFIICADGGYSHAKAENIRPHVVIGDFDSIDPLDLEADLKEACSQEGCTVLRMPAEKDDTDTMICLKYGMEKGCGEFFFLGGLGGRLDHTMSNLQTMSYGLDHGKSAWFLDGKNRATLRNPGTLSLPRLKDFRFSLFSFSDSCRGVSIRGAKYPLENHLLTNSLPVGVSNEFVEETAEISHTSGKLLILLSRD